MDRSHIKQKLHRYMFETLFKSRTGPVLSDGESLIDNEVLDSTGVLELVLFIEETFGVRVEDDEIVPENLDSMNSLVHFVERKQSAFVSQK